MCRLMTVLHSEKCIVRRFRLCANMIACTYTNRDGRAYYTPRWYGIACRSMAKNLYGMLLY